MGEAECAQFFVIWFFFPWGNRLTVRIWSTFVPVLRTRGKILCLVHLTDTWAHCELICFALTFFLLVMHWPRCLHLIQLVFHMIYEILCWIGCLDGAFTVLISNSVIHSFLDIIGHLTPLVWQSVQRTFTGELFTWGRDEGEGRLGLGPGGGPGEGGSFSTPSKVDALPVPAAAVSCGGFFTMALSSEGKLWSWGGVTSSSSNV